MPNQDAKLKKPILTTREKEARQFLFKLSRYISYKWNPTIFLLSMCFSVGALVVYGFFFDILVPFIPGGSVKASYGVYFVIPIVLLVSAQTLFTTWLAHISVSTGAPGKGDALRAYLVASVEVFLFSLYYVIFPFHGPYTFIVYFTPANTFGQTALAVVIGWTMFIIVVTFVLLRRVFRLEGTPRFGPVRMLLLAATMLAMMLVTAS
ncbi:MAG TPA: hypothetical protein VGR56_03950 [Nitrososphaerales archaeon]|nr:hypothetical protein [Nitrososphaerales archaeon]